MAETGTSWTNHVREPSAWRRFGIMLLFAPILCCAGFLVGFIALFQFFTVLASGETNPHLAGLGRELARFSKTIMDFLTYNTERAPFPFAPWPAEPTPPGTVPPPRRRKKKSASGSASSGSSKRSASRARRRKTTSRTTTRTTRKRSTSQRSTETKETGQEPPPEGDSTDKPPSDGQG